MKRYLKTTIQSRFQILTLLASQIIYIFTVNYKPTLKKVSTSKLAKEFLGVATDELWKALVNEGYLNENRELTEKGKQAGGEPKSFNNVNYVAWPSNFDPLNRNLLGIKEIGTRLKVSPQRINKLLNTGGFIEKATKGWSITKLGRRLGGVEKTYTPTGAKYVIWPEKTIESNRHFRQIFKTLSNSDITPENLVDENPAKEKSTLNLPKGQYKTNDGHYVRSRAEVIIDNWLFENKLPHAYERSLPIEEEVICDWYIPSFGTNTTKSVYIEFWGMDTDKYLERKQEKLSIYKKYSEELYLIELEDKDLSDLDRVLSSKLTGAGINVAHT